MIDLTFGFRNLAFMKYLSLRQQWVLFFLALLILGVLYFKFYYSPLPSSPEKVPREIVVEVTGEVRNPGDRDSSHCRKRKGP